LTDRVLVTGASGFIGYHLVSALLDHGHHIRCLVRPTSELSQLPLSALELVTGDILDPPSLATALDGIDAVYHLAGEIDGSAGKRLYRANVEGTRNLAAACAAAAKPPVLVLVSTLEAGGPDPNGRARTEHDPAAPLTHYGRSKLEGERAAAEFAGRVPITVVRAAAVFGEYDRQTLNIFKAFRLAGLGIYPLPRANRQRLSMVHAGDLAEFLLLAAERGERLDSARPETDGIGLYYPAAGEPLTLGEAIRTAAEGLGDQRVRIVDVPLALAFVVTGLAELWSRVSGRSPGVMTLDKARAAAAGSWTCSPKKSQQLGWETDRPVRERLRQTVRWYRQQGWL